MQAAYWMGMATERSWDPFSPLPRCCRVHAGAHWQMTPTHTPQYKRKGDVAWNPPLPDALSPGDRPLSTMLKALQCGIH